MTDKALGWTLRIGGVAGVVLILWLIQVMLPDFYSTMWWLMIRGDLDGLTDYIASFGYRRKRVYDCFRQRHRYSLYPLFDGQRYYIWLGAGDFNFLGRRSHRH